MKKFYVQIKNLYGKAKKFNYTISNLNSDQTFTFYYKSKGGSLFLMNPFNTYHIKEGKEDCQDYVAKYIFKKRKI